jgi:GntR family transcriptional regulator/MocR family aminotransferase
MTLALEPSAEVHNPDGNRAATTRQPGLVPRPEAGAPQRMQPRTMRDSAVCDRIRHGFCTESDGELLHLRLYQAMRKAILGGHLPAGTLLPGTRVLARELELARNTVARAYERLLTEGYLESGSAGANCYVSDSPSRLRPRPVAKAPAASMAGISARGRELMRDAASGPIQRGAFMPGIPDTEHFPFEVWRRLLAKSYRRERGDLLQYAQSSYGPLKRALAQHLNITRMMHCAPHQIVVVNGTHQALDLCARLLADPGDGAWIENPGYWGGRNVLRAAGLVVRPIAVDRDGIAPTPQDWAQPPRLILVSPSSQYPTGAVLSLERRLQLLAMAEASASWILEDDYDNELRYQGSPIASMFGLTQSERVIYFGTFSKVMFTGLRLSYIVVPESLVDAFAAGNAELYRGGRLAEQAALAEFIEMGHFAAHIRRMRAIYTERREALRGVLTDRLGDAVEVSGHQAGLQLLCRLGAEVDDRALAARALQAGIVTRPLSLYACSGTAVGAGLNLGYAAVPVDTVVPTAHRLADFIERELAG